MCDLVRAEHLQLLQFLSNFFQKTGLTNNPSKKEGLSGAETQDRTVDTTIFSRVLYQLSYLGSG